MKKFIIIKNCEYVEGYLRSGHAEIEIEAENIEEAKEKNQRYKLGLRRCDSR